MANVRIDVYSGDGCGLLDAKLDAVIGRLEKIRAEIPEEFRTGAGVDLSVSGDGYGGVSSEVTVYYDRPETPEEAVARASVDAKHRAFSESRERAELAKLWAKYGPPPSGP